MEVLPSFQNSVVKVTLDAFRSATSVTANVIREIFVNHVQKKIDTIAVTATSFTAVSVGDFTLSVAANDIVDVSIAIDLTFTTDVGTQSVQARKISIIVD